MRRVMSSVSLLPLFLRLLCLAVVAHSVRLPNTARVDGQLTANLGVDHFFSLWIVFNNDDVVISDEPFTILAPKNSDTGIRQLQLQQPEAIKRLLNDHIIIGAKVNLQPPHASATNVQPRGYTTLSGRNVTLIRKESSWRANSAVVLDSREIEPNGLLIVLDNFLFPDEVHQDPHENDNQTQSDAPHREASKESKEHSSGSSGNSGNSGNSNKESKEKRLNESEAGAAMTVLTVKEEAPAVAKRVTFIENVMQVLSLLKSGVRVFQHFLSRSNVSKLLNDEDEYTVFVPTDHAFQRWHPIDWGFYPFSVPEFTETVIINHFVKGKLKQEGIKPDQIVKTLGGKEIVFRKAPNLTVNGASVVKGDTPLPKGNIMFISEVLFVSESVVSRLHQQHRDKETPPLLAFPWFGAQFLSHAFLALERDRRFTHITRFLNLADLAPHVSGTGYTFFVPTDTAFEEIGLDKMPDNYLSTGDGLEILLNHFVKGRLYDRDLKDSLKLLTLGNRIIDIGRRKENVTVNKAHIVESEVFVYNLGTMYYIDKVLFAKPELLPKIRRTTTTTSMPTTISTTTTETSTTSYDNVTDLDESTLPTTTIHMQPSELTTTVTEAAVTSSTSVSEPGPGPTTTTEADVERVPEELAESGGSMPDVLFSDAESDNAATSVGVALDHRMGVAIATATTTKQSNHSSSTTTTTEAAQTAQAVSKQQEAKSSVRTDSTMMIETTTSASTITTITSTTPTPPPPTTTERETMTVVV